MLGPVFWRTSDPPQLTAYPTGWPERLEADHRRTRVWSLGVILHDASREHRIRAKQDWRTLLSPTLARYPMPLNGERHG